MKERLICRMSPLGRPVSQQTMRKKQLMAGNRKCPHKLYNQPHEPFKISDHNISGLSYIKSPWMRADDSLTDSSKTKKQDDNPQAVNEIYLKPGVLKRKKFSSCTTMASGSSRIQKRQNSMPFVSPGKRLLSRCMNGLDNIHRRRTVSMTTVDMKKLEQVIESQIRKKKNRKIDSDTLSDGSGISLSANGHDVSPFSSSMFPGMRADDSLADSSKTKEQDDNPQAIEKIYLKPVVLKRKKSSSCSTVASRSPRIQKRRNSMSFVSPGKRLLSRCMNGLDSIHRRRTVSMTTVDMKKLEQAIECQIRKKKNRKLDVNTQQCELEVSITTNDHCVSGLSSTWSSGMKRNDFLVDSSKSQGEDVNPQGTDEIHLKPTEIKRKKSSSLQTMSAASRSPRIQKQQKSLIFISPGKRLLSRSMRGLDEIHRRHTVSMTPTNMRKLKEAIERHVRKKKKNEKFDVDMQPHEFEASYTRDHDISGLSSSRSSGMKADEFLADSLKSQEKGDVLQMIDEMYLKSEVPKRKKSCNTISLSSRSPRIHKGRNSMPYVSPGKRLSRSMHGLNKIHQRRTVSMTTVEMNKLEEFIDLCQRRKKEENEKVDVETQLDGPDTSSTASDPNVPDCSSSPGIQADVFLAGLKLNKTLDSSQSLKHNEDLQRSNDSFLKCKITKRKDSSSCKKICSTSRSPRIQKHRKSVPFVSPVKMLLSRSMHGLDKIHQRRTVSMTTVEMNKLQEFIDLSQIRKKEENEKVDVETQQDGSDTSSTASDPNVPDSSSSPGVPADVFLAGLELNKTLDSSQSLEHNEDLQRSNYSFLKCKITKRKYSSSCKKICAALRSPRIKKHRHSVPFVSPGKQLLSRSMRGLDQIHRCRSLSMTKLDREKLQEAIDLSHIKKKKKSEKAGRSPLRTFKSPNHKIKETVTAVDNMRQSDKMSCLKRQHSIEAEKFSMDDKAVAPKQKKQEEPVIHASSIEIQVNTGTPDLDCKKLDEMYKRRFNPSPECTQTLVNMDTVTRILSFQDEENDSRKASPPIIQRCAFAGDIIDPESEVSDSTVDEANESLLEKEVRSFFESKKGHSPRDFREGALALVVASSCIDQKTENGVSESELVISEGQKMRSQTVPENDDIMVIDEDTHYRTPDSRRFIEDMEKLEEETYHSILDSPRDIDDLHKLEGNTHHGTPDSLRDSEHLQKPSNIEGLQKLAENTLYSIQDSPRDIEDMQKLEGNTHHGIPDILRDTKVLHKPRNIEDLQKPTGNTSYSVPDSPRDFEDMQKPDENMHHSIPDNNRDAEDLQKPRNIQDLQKLAENTDHSVEDRSSNNEDMQNLEGNMHHGTPDSSTNTDNLHKLMMNTSRPCSQENTDSETVFVRNKNEQIVPKGKSKLQILSQKPDSSTHQDHAMVATRTNFGELMPTDVEMDGLWEDMCTPFQHSTPADPTHHPKSHKISTEDLLSAWAEIEEEKKMFVIYCHEDTAPSILKDLDNCPTVIDGKSLSLRYLNDGSSVEVQGMVLMNRHLDKSKKSPKKNKKDAAKKKKGKKVLTTTGAAGKKKDASKKKKKINAVKETNEKKKETKTETKKEPKRKTKQKTKTECKIETKIEAKQDARKEVIKEMIGEINKKTQKGMKKGTKKMIKKNEVKETNQEAEKEIKKPSKKEIKKPSKKEIKKPSKKEIRKPSKKKTKMRKRKEVKSGKENENREDAKKNTNEEKRKETNKEVENEIQKPTEKKTKTKKRKEIKSGVKEETREGAKKETKKNTNEGKREETNKEVEQEIQKPGKKQIKTKTRKEVKSGTDKETREDAKKKTTKKTNEEKRKETNKEVEQEIQKPTEKKTKTKKRKGMKSGTEKGARKKTKKKSNEEKRKVTVTGDVNLGQLKIISGPITGAARKRNESRWEHELKEQSETPLSKITVQPSMESDLCMLRCLKTSLQQPANVHINQDRDRGFKDDDSDLDTFVDFLSFPDVFMTEKKDRPSFRKVPPNEIKILIGS